MSLGEFLSEEQNKQDENQQMMEQLKAEFFSACSQLVNQIRSWLMIETSSGQVEIEQPQGLGNVYGSPPSTYIKTKIGNIKLTPSDGLIFGAKGIITATSGNKLKKLVLKDQWYIKDVDPAFNVPGAAIKALEDYPVLDEHTFAKMAEWLLKK